jgi:hypothetical protein
VQEHLTKAVSAGAPPAAELRQIAETPSKKAGTNQITETFLQVYPRTICTMTDKFLRRRIAMFAAAFGINADDGRQAASDLLHLKETARRR